MDIEDDFNQNSDSGNCESSSVDHVANNNLGDHLESLYTFGCQTRQHNSDTFKAQARCSESLVIEHEINTNTVGEDCLLCLSAPEPFCHVKLESLSRLKDSTKKLLCLLEGLQKTHLKSTIPSDEAFPIGTDISKPISILPEIVDLISSKAKQETEGKTTDAVYVENNEEDDCSIYKRLTRKCHCLNRYEYNDFIIHFNESTKYFTSTMGEIIKNMRTLKKFLYMGGNYARHALMFLNEGYTYSNHMEKVDITQGCAHADICNVFDDQSIVVVCLSWPCDCDAYGGDPSTQALTTSFLNKLVQLEEGRRYLKFSSKITSDLKKIIRKHSNKLDLGTLELLNSTLNILNPSMAQNTNVTYYCKPVDEGFGSKTVSALLRYRQYMTIEEVFTHIDLLHNLSNSDSGRNELTTLLPKLLNLFIQLLTEYDNSEMNIIVTNILNNIVSRTMIKPLDLPRTIVMADTATDPIQMKNEMSQIPLKKNIKKESLSKAGMGMQPYKFRQPSKVRWESPISKSKFTKDPNCSIIVVPIEE